MFFFYTKSHSTIHSFSFPLKHLTPMTESNWIPYYRPHPLGPGHYDFFTDHVRFNETCVRHFLPNDTVFISSVREPLDNFVSAYYYNGKLPRTLPGEQLPAIHFLFLSILTLLYLLLSTAYTTWGVAGRKRRLSAALGRRDVIQR